MESQQTVELSQNPKERASLISNIFFCFIIPIFRKGNKRYLDNSDLYKALEAHKSSYLGDKLSKSWEKEIQNQKRYGVRPRLLRAILRAFGREILKLGFTIFTLEFCFKITQPIFLGSLVAYYSKPENGNISEAYLYAGALILCCALNVPIYHYYMLCQRHCGMKLRVALISMIYRKALRLTTTALGTTTAGQIVNLLSNDVGKMDMAIIFLQYLWLGPLMTIVIVFLMYKEIGISAVAGVVFLVLFVPLQGYLGRKTSIFREKTAHRTDERIRLMNEIIRGIQVIKMYSWETPFGRLVASARNREIKVIRYGSYIASIITSFLVFVTRFSIFTSLVVYATLGQVVTAEKAFVVTAFYNLLRTPMTDFFPKGISQLAENLVSIKRIEKFMLYPEMEQKLVNENSVPLEKYTPQENGTEERLISTGDKVEVMTFPSAKPFLKLNSMTAKWNPAICDNTLNDINLEANPGDLVAIIGPVGAGKSSIFQAILGELSITSGTIQTSGKISYASQEPWLFGDTIQQNILFGQPMDRNHYDLVVKKCALEHDFILLPHGDQTIVGDRGASLSGGQRARINLARAIYRKSAIYLLDDPLSAVDTNVGRHLFDQCIRDFLRNNIVVLVTHQLQHLRQADRIIIIDRGKISAIGTFTELQDSKVDFANLLDSEKEDVVEEVVKTPKVVEAIRKQSIDKQSKPNGLSGPDSRMLVKETQKSGAIGISLYAKYFKSGGGIIMFVMMLSFCICAQVLGSGSDYFLAYWVNREKSASSESASEELLIHSYKTIDIEPKERDIMDVYIFSILILGTIFVSLTRSFLFFNVAMKASRNLHNAMYVGVTRATMYFFHTNPLGRILNRFSKDMGQVDELLPSVMIDVIQISLSLVGVIVVVAIVNYWFLVPTVLMIFIFYKLRNFYLKTARNIKRMEAVTRSPIFSHLTASLTGLPTIRAFKAEKILIREFDTHQDSHSSVFFTFLATTRAFGFWLDSICIIYVAIVTLSFFVMGKESGGNVGLAITQALSMTGIVQWGMRQSAELENLMTAVERIVEYETIATEEDSMVKKDPPQEWPHEGRIKFENVTLRYFSDPDSDAILKELTFEILPREKIGIVGRTGAGKTSMINALLRLAYNEGSIRIDNINIENIPLNKLRSKISMIPQEPVLFSGSVRYNLDPFDEYTDAKLWQVLNEVDLNKVVASLPDGLHSKVTEGGSNFSVGQRQLFCLARAILRANQILVMDEATANVDPQTDAQIQATIREKFKECTVITIAHRLHTVMDSDKILVMDAGRVIEYDAPYVLLTETESKVLLKMVEETGKTMFRNLMKIAKTAYELKKMKEWERI